MTLGAVGIPIVGLPTWELMRSIIALKSPKGFQYITSGEYRRPLPIDEARNIIVKEFLSNSQLEWLLFVDSDAVLHPLTLMRLLSWNMPIVSALCLVRSTPAMPSVWGKELEPGKYQVAIQPVIEWLAKHPQLLTQGATILPRASKDALWYSPFVGMHTTLIRREVIEAVGEPYFVVDPTSEKRSGEDVWFCQRALEKGYKSYVDFSVFAGHQYHHEFAGLDLQMSVLWMQQKEEFIKKHGNAV